MLLNNHPICQTVLVVFTYNRPSHTQQTLEHLEKCPRLHECDIVLISDGLHNDDHRDTIQATRQILNEWASQHQAKVVVREHNLGLKRNIETGVSDLFQQYKRVIVLEDDLLVSPAFVDFMLQALDFYETDERVMQITGFTFPFEPDAPQGAILVPFSSTWGWATWARAWQYYNPDATEAYKTLKNSENAYSFDLNGSYTFTQMLFSVVERGLQSWGVLFWYAVWRQSGLVVIPRRSLVMNIGFDGSGVNSDINREGNIGRLDSYSANIWRFPLEQDKQAFNKLCYYLKHHVAAKKPTFVRSVVTMISQFIRNHGN